MSKDNAKTISSTEFKAKCLRLLKHLPRAGLVITSHNKPVARVLPYKKFSTKQLIALMKGKIKIKGDIYSTGLNWDVES